MIILFSYYPIINITAAWAVGMPGGFPGMPRGMPGDAPGPPGAGGGPRGGRGHFPVKSNDVPKVSEAIYL